MGDWINAWACRQTASQTDSQLDSQIDRQIDRQIRIKYVLVYKEVRQQGRFAGFSIYVSSDGTRDNSSLCYKDGPKLPALNFTTTCFMSGRYVTFYNERSHDVTYPNGYVVHPVYTELCEVIVHGKNIYKSLSVLLCVLQLALISMQSRKQFFVYVRMIF